MTLAGLKKFDRQICGTVWTGPHPQRIMDTLCYNIGPRIPGSKGMRQAQDFLIDILKQLDASDVHTEPAPVFVWRDASSHVKLVRPRVRRYQNIHCVHSAKDKLQAPLLDGGGAHREELERLGNRLRGAVLLVRGHEISGGKVELIQKRIHQACQFGVAGILLMNM